MSSQTTEQTGSSPGELAWLYALVLCIMVPLLLCCIGSCVLYRISGGEIGLWAKVHYTHTNEKIAFRYCSAEERAQAANDLQIYQKAMTIAVGGYSNGCLGYVNMARDHRKFIQAGGLEGMRQLSVYDPPYVAKQQAPQEEPTPQPAAAPEPTKPAKPPDAGAGALPTETELPAPSTAAAEAEPARVLPDQPSIDAELDQEFAESPEDRARRLEWIKYFVREGDLQRAFDLGWDGKPFKQSAVIRTTSLTEALAASKTDVEPAAAPPAGTMPTPRASTSPVPPTTPAVTEPDADPAPVPAAAADAGPSGPDPTDVQLHRI